MDSTVFEQWVKVLDNQFEKENRKVALIIDNCTTHPEIGELKAIDLFCLPPNTTSVLQPMDQGVKSRQDKKDGNKSLPNISVLDAMKMIVLSWDEG